MFPISVAMPVAVTTAVPVTTLGLIDTAIGGKGVAQVARAVDRAGHAPPSLCAGGGGTHDVPVADERDFGFALAKSFLQTEGRIEADVPTTDDEYPRRIHPPKLPPFCAN